MVLIQSLIIYSQFLSTQFENLRKNKENLVIYEFDFQSP